MTSIQNPKSKIQNLVLALGVTVLLVAGCLPKSTWFAKTDQAQQLAQQARQAEDRGDAAQAEHLLTAAVQTNPRDCETRLELSEMLLEHGSCDSAVRHLRQIMEQNPDDARPVVRLAEAMHTRGDFVEATRLADRALRMEPTHVEALLLRGRLYEHNRQDEAALSCYCRAYQADNEHLEPCLRLAALHLRHQRPRQASPLLRTALDRTDLSTELRARTQWLLGQSYAQERRWPESVEQLSTAASRRTMSADDWYQLAYASYHAGDLTLARQAVDATLELSPRHESATAMSEQLARRTVSR